MRVEESYTAELLGGGARGVGYLLKEGVGRVDEFLDALDRGAAGITALDPGSSPHSSRTRLPASYAEALSEQLPPGFGRRP